jgi:probable F420-dependent oxidoreductase
MKFGASFGPAPHTQSLAIAQAADESGFDQLWAFDSHVIWQDWCSLVGWLVAHVKSETMQFGTCVTHPRTRDPMVTASAFATLNAITGGRMICGIGRGDSAVRVVKRRPANLADVEAAVLLIRALAAGEKVDVDGVEVQMPWAAGRLPVYVAGYGPKALTMAGRVADGVIFQVADPYFIEWGLRWVRQGAEEAGRDAGEIVIHCATATYVSDDRAAARDKVRYFPAVVGNHIADILRHHDDAEMPAELFDYVHGRTAYDYREHGVVGAEHSKYVPDEIVDRFCVLGSEEECEAKLLELAAIGVSEFNIYPFLDEVPEVIRRYGRTIAPRVRERAKRAELSGGKT